MVSLSNLLLFISYASEHEVAVRQLRTDLKKAGFNVWFAPTSISKDSPDWQDAIFKGIDSAGAFIYVGSKEARTSENVRAEVAHALRRGMTIYCFWVHGENWEDCRPYELAKYHRIDGRGHSYPQGLSELIYDLRKGRGAEDDQFSESQVSADTMVRPSIPKAETRDVGGRKSTPDLSKMAGNSSAGINLFVRERLTNEMIEKIEAVLQKAEALQRQGHIREAIDVCMPLLSNGADVAMVRYYLGFLCQMAERYEEAMEHYKSSRFYSDYTVASCHALGQCASAVGNLRDALEYFDQAFEFIPFDQLEEHDAGLLIELCYDAANAYMDNGDAVEAKRISTALLRYLYTRQWERHFEIATHLMGEMLTRRWKSVSENRPMRESHPFDNKMPQRAIDTAEGHPQPGPLGQGVRRLDEASQAGIWPTPPHMPVVLPIDRIAFEEGMSDTSPMLPAVRAAPPDLLAEIIAGMIGPKGNLPAFLHAIWPHSSMRVRLRVSQRVRELGMRIESGKLMAARSLCLELLDLAPEYYDIEAALAEIYVRQGDVERAVRQYNHLANRYQKDGDDASAISSYQRLLQLDANNLEGRQKLSGLLAQQKRSEASAITSTPSASTIEDVRKPTSAPSSAQEATDLSARAEFNSSGMGLDATIPGRSLVNSSNLPSWIAEAGRTQEQQLDVLAKYAQYYQQGGQIENAIQVLREMTQLAPNDPLAFGQLANIYTAVDQFDERINALQALANVYERRGESSQAAQSYQRMAEITWAAHRPSDALTLQRQAVCREPDNMALRQVIVRYCMEMGRDGEAIEQQEYIADTYLDRRNVGKAKTALRDLIRLDRMRIRAYDLLGQLYCVEAAYEEGAAVYRDLAAVDPDNLLARRRLKEIAARQAEIEARNSPDKAEDA